MHKGFLDMISRDERKQIWVVLAGFLIVVVGFGISLYSSRLVGVTVSLVGALILLAGSVMISVASKAAKPKLPKTVEEQRQIIRAMADDIRQKTDQ